VIYASGPPKEVKEYIYIPIRSVVDKDPSLFVRIRILQQAKKVKKTLISTTGIVLLLFEFLSMNTGVTVP
jgi:hypothetical protein